MIKPSSLALACAALTTALLTGCATNPTHTTASSPQVPAMPSTTAAPTSPRAYMNEAQAGTSRDTVIAAIGQPAKSSMAGGRRTDTYTITEVSPMGVASCGLLGAATGGIGLLLCQPTKKSTLTVRYVQDKLDSYN